MLFEPPKDLFRVQPNYVEVLHALGFTARTVFADSRVKVWRKLPDRENCTFNATLPDGNPVRFHIKRYPADNSLSYAAKKDAVGHFALAIEGIPTAPLVGYGKLTSRASFYITDDLAGFSPGDKILFSNSADFDALLEPTADLTARLHSRGLHHRDLYLCHFFIRLDDNAKVDDVRLIDTARVARLPRFFNRRWIVKDLAQFWYSTTKHPQVTDEQRRRWLERYASQRNIPAESLRPAIQAKARQIARHDAKLNVEQPKRHESIPG